MSSEDQSTLGISKTSARYPVQLLPHVSSVRRKVSNVFHFLSLMYGVCLFPRQENIP